MMLEEIEFHSQSTTTMMACYVNTFTEQMVLDAANRTFSGLTWRVAREGDCDFVTRICPSIPNRIDLFLVGREKEEEENSMESNFEVGGSDPYGYVICANWISQKSALEAIKRERHGEWEVSTLFGKESVDVGNNRRKWYFKRVAEAAVPDEGAVRRNKMLMDSMYRALGTENSADFDTVVRQMQGSIPADHTLIWMDAGADYSKKINVIKAMRLIMPQLGLKDAKDFTEGCHVALATKQQVIAVRAVLMVDGFKGESAFRSLDAVVNTEVPF